MFFGRQDELRLLEEKYNSSKGELIVAYGRRRIGKSKLIEEFCKNRKALFFEGLEDKRTPDQIKHFMATLQNQVSDPLLQGTQFSNWNAAFTYLSNWLSHKKGKVVILFDELQWMAAGRKYLVSLIKYYWDNHWKKQNAVLILCGSVASFMIDQVIRSNALYGRITLELPIKGLDPKDCEKMFKGKRSREEVLKYLMIFGGVPRYLEEINLNASFDQNISRLCFQPNGLMIREIDRVFYKQFKRTENYLKIVNSIKDNLRSLEEISNATKLKSGGGLTDYLRHLEEAEFIRSYIPIGKDIKSKTKKYRLSDEYLIFYFKFIRPILREIQEGHSKKLFENLVKPNWNSWLGYAFERFCIKHAAIIARTLGFSDQVIGAAPYFGMGDQNFQIDLLFHRSDRVFTLCEIKYYNSPVGTSVIPEINKKCSLFPLPKDYTLETALISLHGPDRPLKEADSITHFMQLDDFFARMAVGRSRSAGH
jgi:uncharacterized protein